MFDIGDTVVHPKHGAGVVMKRRTLQYSGNERQYFCIELTDGRGDVMIPVELVEDLGLREPIRDTALIQQVMDSAPETLVDDVRVRQSGIEQKINSGNIQLLVQALRDLSWRETKAQLSPTDRKLKQNALEKILQELALNPLLAMAAIKLDIENIIQQSMQMHLATIQQREVPPIALQ